MLRQWTAEDCLVGFLDRDNNSITGVTVVPGKNLPRICVLIKLGLKKQL